MGPVAWFKRKTSEPSGTEAESSQAREQAGADDERAALAAADHLAGALPAESGPWDAGAADIPSMPRLDLGPLQLPALQGMQIMPVPDPTNPGRIAALEVVVATAQMQVSLAATRRSGGLWKDIVEEFPELLADQGITCEIVDDGDVRRISATPADGSEAMPMLLEGYQGSGWLLRVIYRGAAATDPYARASLTDIVRGCVASRGDEFLAPGDAIALTLPVEDVESPTQEA